MWCIVFPVKRVSLWISVKLRISSVTSHRENSYFIFQKIISSSNRMKQTLVYINVAQIELVDLCLARRCATSIYDLGSASFQRSSPFIRSREIYREESQSSLNCVKNRHLLRSFKSLSSSLYICYSICLFLLSVSIILLDLEA